MKTDTVFYELFSRRPAELARLLGLEAVRPWSFDSVSVKRVERTIDGVLLGAVGRDGPVFVEVQGYKDDRFFWRVYNEVTAWWMTRPEQELKNRFFRVYVVFIDEDHDPKNSPLTPVPPHRVETMTLREALKRLPDPGLLVVLEPLVLNSLAELEERLPHYRAMIEQLSDSEEERTIMLGLLLQSIMTRFPKLTRKEVKSMITLTPLRETQVFQEYGVEFKEEGRKEGREEGRKEGRLETLQKQLLKLWTLRFGPPVDWVAWRITQCKSQTLLETLFEQVTLAPSPDEAQAHVKAALGNGS